MEFSLQQDETLDHGIRRIFSGIAEDSLSITRPPHEDVHQTVHLARKNFKFFRALLRLIQFPLGPELFRQENHTYRDLSRLVTDLRDTHVMLIILKFVANESHSVKFSDIEQGIKELEKREERILEKALNEEQRFETIVSELESAIRRADEWPAISDAIEVLLPGLKEVYQKGREGFLQAKDLKEKGHFHEWRKQVKYLLHQYEILRNYWPATVNINGTSLQQLSDYLGEEHDLALFEDLIDEKTFEEKLNNVSSLLAYVEQKRTFLQRSALNLGEFIYSQSPDDFISHFEEVESVKKEDT